MKASTSSCLCFLRSKLGATARSHWSARGPGLPTSKRECGVKWVGCHRMSMLMLGVRQTSGFRSFGSANDYKEVQSRASGIDALFFWSRVLSFRSHFSERVLGTVRTRVDCSCIGNFLIAVLFTLSRCTTTVVGSPTSPDSLVGWFLTSRFATPVGPSVPERLVDWGWESHQPRQLDSILRLLHIECYHDGRGPRSWSLAWDRPRAHSWGQPWNQSRIE